MFFLSYIWLIFVSYSWAGSSQVIINCHERYQKQKIYMEIPGDIDETIVKIEHQYPNKIYCFMNKSYQQAMLLNNLKPSPKIIDCKIVDFKIIHRLREKNIKITAFDIKNPQKNIFSFEALPKTIETKSGPYGSIFGSFKALWLIEENTDRGLKGEVICDYDHSV